MTMQIKRIFSSQFLLPLWLITGTCMIFTSCDNTKIKLPESDDTPPKLIWNVYNLDTEVGNNFNGSPTINAKHGERYRITLKAEDKNGGVKFIKINPNLGGGETSYTCKPIVVTGENIAQSKSGLLGPMTQNLSPDADGKVLTSIFLIYNLDFNMKCQDGWQFVGGSAYLTGQASNYHGGITTEKINFKISP